MRRARHTWLVLLASACTSVHACASPDDVVAHQLAPVHTEDASTADSGSEPSLEDKCKDVMAPFGPRIPAFLHYFSSDCALHFSELLGGLSPAVAIDELTKLIGAPIEPPDDGLAAAVCEARPAGWYLDDFRMPTSLHLCAGSCRALRLAILRQVEWDLCASLMQEGDAGSP